MILQKTHATPKKITKQTQQDTDTDTAAFGREKSRKLAIKKKLKVHYHILDGKGV